MKKKEGKRKIADYMNIRRFDSLKSGREHNNVFKRWKKNKKKCADCSLTVAHEAILSYWFAVWTIVINGPKRNFFQKRNGDVSPINDSKYVILLSKRMKNIYFLLLLPLLLLKSVSALRGIHLELKRFIEQFVRMTNCWRAMKIPSICGDQWPVFIITFPFRY